MTITCLCFWEQIEYHGLLASDSEVLVNGNEVAARVDVKAALGIENLAPTATLNKVSFWYSSSEASFAGPFKLGLWTLAAKSLVV